MRRTLLAALGGAVALAFADSSIVVLALPDLIGLFGASVTEVAWVVTSYNLAAAIAALALVPIVRRRDPRSLARAGLLLFLGASLACAAAPAIWLLVAFRALQGLGAALLLCSSLPIARALGRTPEGGSALWAGAAAVGAAVGPAAGGLLSELVDWRAIFLVQAPVAALALGATAVPRRAEGDAEQSAATGSQLRRFAGNAGLAVVSAGLVALLFLSVLLLVNVWGLSPLAAAVVVTAVPVATLLGGPLAVRSGARASTAGVLLLAAGLAGMGLLPERRVSWAAASLFVGGLGLGLLLPRLAAAALAGSRSAASAGTWSIVSRHAGLVAGLLLLTPLVAGGLQAAGQNATVAATARALEAPLPVRDKIELARELGPALANPGSRSLPSFEAELAEGSSELAAFGRSLDETIRAAITRGFRLPFLVGALLVLLALLPLAALRRPPGRARLRLVMHLPTAALLGAVALLAAELGRGALAYGAPPPQRPCAQRATVPGGGLDAAAQRLAMRGIDALACRLGTSRERLVLELADAGVKAADALGRLRSLAVRF